MVGFNEDKHSYKDNQGKDYISVTQWIHQFIEPFDSEYWLMYKTCEALEGGLKKDENGKYLKVKGFYPKVMKVGLKNYALRYINDLMYDIVYKELEQLWALENKKSIEKGSAYHKEQEDIAYYNNSILHPVLKKDVAVIPKEKKVGFDNFYNEITADGCYIEYLIFDEELKIAGQIDKLFVQGKNFWIRDYKTNKEIKYSGKNKMKFPFDKLDDCNFSHYTLQLGLYALLLERKGYKLKGLALEYYDKEIPIEYLKKELKFALKRERG